MFKKIIFLIVLITSFYCFNYPIKGSEAQENEIDLQTSPHKILFDIKNSKPGDTYTKVLKVQNNGSDNFQYLFSNHFLTGSKDLYNELELTVADNSGEIYKGKLKDFEKLDARNLKRNTVEELTLSIYFPYELGNEYQGLDTEFEFKFYVEGTLGGLLPANGPKLPETGTDMFNYILAGSALLIIGLFTQYLLKRKKSDSIV
jgi:LPXTG-motif cell wall-anchored protein